MKKLTIDLSSETTQIIYDKFLNVSRQAIANKITRGQIKFRQIKELNITLVEIPETKRIEFKAWLSQQIKD